MFQKLGGTGRSTLRNRRGLTAIQEEPSSDRRLTGNHITIIAVAACLAAVPGVAFAAQAITATIADPEVPAAQARVSRDGMLGVRGDVLSGPAVPLGAWNDQGLVSLSGETRSRNELIRYIPPRIGVGIGDMTVMSYLDDTYVTFSLHAIEADPVHGCANLTRPSSLSDGLLRRVTSVRREQGQLTFPIPLTVYAGPRGTCLVGQVAAQGSTDVAYGVAGIEGMIGQPFIPPSAGK